MSNQPGDAYTDNKKGRVSTLTLVMSPSIDRKTVLRGLTAGFAVVILLLAAAAYISISRSRNIQNAAAELVKGHVLNTELVDHLQMTQQSLSNILLDILDPQRSSPPPRLDKFEADIREVTRAGHAAAPHEAWPKLAALGHTFADTARQAAASTGERRNAIEDQLESLRKDFTILAGDLVRAQDANAARLLERIDQQSRQLNRESVWLFGACLALSIAGAAMTIQITQRSFRLVKWQSEELNHVSWQMLQTQEAAARRFSHEMHDELGQSLTGLKAMLVSVRPEEFPTRRVDCVHLLDEAIGNVRELSQLLRPVILDDFGLSAGLRWLADRFSQRTRIEVDYTSSLEDRLADEIETHLFRITQEALTNVARHSGANRARIHLGAVDGRVLLTIEDDGVGLPVVQRKRSTLGMVGMRARARQIGGELSIGAVRPHGVRIEVWAPRKEAESDAAEKDAGVAG